MKVHIGPYLSWFGPYQMADLLQKVGVSEDRCHEIGKWLADTWVGTFLNWIHSKKKRRVKVKLHSYDSWNLDDTLSIIILPLLKQLKATKHGYGFIEDADVPEHLRSTAAPPKENEYDWDDNASARYEWVLDEMIWAFEQLTSDWEAQFHSGEHDILWEPTSLDADGKPLMYEMKAGPKDTHKFDFEGYQRHSKRIDNGVRLFGTYYRTLWD